MMWLFFAILAHQDWLDRFRTRDGIEITSSVSLPKAEQLLSSPDTSGQRGIIKIKGANLVIDFGGSTVRGTRPDTLPSERVGTCIEVEGENVTIKNLNVHGYKVGLIAKSIAGLHIVDCNFSYNWKQHLGSTTEREDESDWMSFHQNEHDEWLRYGAGIYLQKCRDFEVKHVKIEGGQCGLLMNGCTDGSIWNNNFSFLSAVGIGLYRSSGNRIMHNNVDWCVRGYSDGVYNRGQDSAGILVYEQSNRNIFAYNSVTHGGDGFFLWAGQSTMDSGEGGCNDNVVLSNDFSHAPTNGIESTFSRNRFSNNKVLECWHGVWAGYSYDSRFDHNIFGLNANVTAIEHGQNNIFDHNRSYRDLEGIAIWQNPSQDPKWGYPKHHDTMSHGMIIEQNTFSNVANNVLRLNDTKDVKFSGNTVLRPGMFSTSKPTVTGFTTEKNIFEITSAEVLTPLIDPTSKANQLQIDPINKPLPPTIRPNGLEIPGLDRSPSAYRNRFDVAWTPYLIPADLKVGVMKGAVDPFLSKDVLQGRRYILVDEWGPYDFKSPRLCLREIKDRRAFFEVLGPRGAWDLESQAGISHPSATSGVVPGEFSATLDDVRSGWQKVVLSYHGSETTDFRGVVSTVGSKVGFGWNKYFIAEEWTVNYFRFDLQTQDPLGHESAFKNLLKARPFLALKKSSLDFAGSGEPAPGVGATNYAITADGVIQVEQGRYNLDVTSDDGVRVFVDGKLTIEDWTHHSPVTDSVPVYLQKGTHRIHIDYFQLDGYATLRFRLRPPSS